MVVLAVLGWFDWALGWGWAVLGLWAVVLWGTRVRCLRAGGRVSLVREVDGVQVVGRSFEVGLVVRNEGGRRVQVAIFEHLEAGLVAKGLPLVVNLQAGEVRRLEYEVCGQQRGRWAILGGAGALWLALGVVGARGVFRGGAGGAGVSEVDGFGAAGVVAGEVAAVGCGESIAGAWGGVSAVAGI